MDTNIDGWEITANRFVAFFDILGFKDLVLKSSHEHVLEQLKKIKQIVQKQEEHQDWHKKEYNICPSQTKSVIFSDSIIIFSKSNTDADALKITMDAHFLLFNAMKEGIPIKGALSYGEITVNFKDSLFFGRPIIDAYLLHEELQMLTAIIDNNYEMQIEFFPNVDVIKLALRQYKANLKQGNITHNLIAPSTDNHRKEVLINLGKQYKNVSGMPRKYIDNTVDFLKYIIKNPQ